MSTIEEFSKEIILASIMPSKPSFDIPFLNRANYRTAFWLVDAIPERLGVKKIGEVDFVNEMEYIALMHEAYILGEDPSFQCVCREGIPLKYNPYKYQKERFYIPHCIGDRIIDKEWNVYKIFAFYSNDCWSRSQIYFDVK